MTGVDSGDQVTTEGFYLYGVVPAGTDLPTDVSTMGGDLVLREHKDLAVVGEWVDVSRPLGRKRHLVAHSEVLNALAQHGPVIPLQFGSVVDSEEAAQAEFLESASERLVELLEQLRGILQYVVRARYDQETVLSDVVQHNPEIAELRRRTSGQPEGASRAERVRLGELVAAELEARRSEHSQWLQEQLSDHVEAIAGHGIAGMDALAEFAVSVRADVAADFEEQMEALAERMHPWARLSLVGPMALYDFIPEH